MTIYKFLFFCFLAVMFASCDDDFDPSTSLNGTKSDITAMLRSNDIVQRASVDSDNFTFTSSAGTIVSAQPNSFVFEDGTVATGFIEFEMTELFTKSKILQYGIPTMTYNGEILESDGEFLFGASQGSLPLRLADGKRLNLSVSNSDPNRDMQLFRPIEGLWGVNADPDVSIEITDSIGLGYDVFVIDLDWVNIDYFTKFDLELTDVSLCLPENYKDSEVSLWVVFKDLDIVLSTDGRSLPIGEEIYVVCIAAEDEDTFRLDIQEHTIEADLKINLDPKRTSAEDIQEKLEELD